LRVKRSNDGLNLGAKPLSRRRRGTIQPAASLAARKAATILSIL
jgi:hypothetical protein